MRKLYDAETSLKHEVKRKSAGADVNSFEFVIGLLCMLAGYGFLAEGALPPQLLDKPVVRLVYTCVSLGYLLSGAGIIIGLGARVVFIERAALLLLAPTLILHGLLCVALPSVKIDVLQVLVIVAVFFACLGRLRVLRLIR